MAVIYVNKQVSEKLINHPKMNCSNIKTKMCLNS